MKLLALAALCLIVSGCAPFRQELPPWARPVPAVPPPEAPVASDTTESVTASSTPVPEPIAAPAPPAAPPVTTPVAPPVISRATPPPAAPAPAAPPRSPAPAPAAAVPPLPAPVPAGPPAGPSPPLTASLPPAEVRRLQDEAQRRIEEAERLLRQLDGRPLAPQDVETLRLAQSLVEQARKALGGQEYERAANLATKARTLADDVSTKR